jgi:hypothetical protein
MMLPYHELFAGMTVLLATDGNPTAESDIVARTGKPHWRTFRWDQRTPIDNVVRVGKGYVYRFFEGARCYLWDNYFKNARPQDYARLMETFIRASELHLERRVARGELKMKSYARRAPLLNREFIEIFSHLYDSSAPRLL